MITQEGYISLLGTQQLPSEEFELTAFSLGAHFETHGKPILRTLSYLAVSSQDDKPCELAMSLL